MKYSFVILHYLGIQDTMECVESIENLYVNADWRIVIVDNGSRNDTGRELAEKYQDNDRVTVLCLKENIGFAKGNNVGYAYAKEHFSPDFILVINNDVIFKQPEFLDEIDKLYEEEAFDVLGPDVLNLSETKHTSPMDLSLRSLKKYKISLLKQALIVKSREKGGIWKPVEGFLNVFSQIVNLPNGKNTKSLERENVTRHQCVLQGACFIFSPKFITTRKEAFYPGTFLYHEESILLYQMMIENRKLLYSPRLWLVHKGDSSAIMERNEKAELFKVKEDIKSRKILIKMMEENKRRGH